MCGFRCSIFVFVHSARGAALQRLSQLRVTEPWPEAKSSDSAGRLFVFCFSSTGCRACADAGMGGICKPQLRWHVASLGGKTMAELERQSLPITPSARSCAPKRLASQGLFLAETLLVPLRLITWNICSATNRTGRISMPRASKRLPSCGLVTAVQQPI